MSAYVLEFEIGGLPKMTNTLRLHWRAKARHASEWKAKVRIACTLRNKPPQPLDRATLTLTRMSSVEPDADGLVSGFKHIVDGLVECGVLANDKSANIGFPNYRWEFAPKGRGKIRVRIESTEPNEGEIK